MNKLCYRIVFNKARGLLMAVAEGVASQGKASSETPARSQRKRPWVAAIKPLAFLAWCLLGLVSLPAAQAQIVTDSAAPGSQRPTVLNAPNGVPLVNIQTPSAAGVSRNTYSQFDVQQQGAILNNSRTHVQTQLGGWVQGNPWLGAGSARVILNEVNASNPSSLRGYVEVAGQRAQVVIANPAGVNCDGCGFINANRATLTTGTPIFNGGNLDGYRVQGGTVTITGLGLDASTTDYTDIIARAVQVNAGIWANQLNLLAGPNQVAVDPASGAATSNGSISGTGPAPAFAIDTALLGGMYAGKIVLVATEDGVGVRHAGAMQASSGDLVLGANGHLENAGRITSTGDTRIDAQGGVQNAGTVYAQGNALLGTRGSITNSGTIAAKGDATLTADGQGSRITGTSGSVMAAGVQVDGSVGATGNLTAIATLAIAGQGQSLSGGDQHLAARSIDLSGSQTSATNLSLAAGNGSVDLAGATVTASQTLNASASQTLRTDGANVSAEQVVAAAHDLSNVQGVIVQTGSGDLTLTLPGTLNNAQGRIATNSANLNLAAATLVNTDGRLEHAGAGALTIVTPTLSGARGQITSNGRLDLTATSATLDAAITTASQLTLHSDTLSHRNGTLIQTGGGTATLAASTLLDNTGGTIASNGHTALTTGALHNNAGRVEAAQALGILASGIDNTDGTIIGQSLGIDSNAQTLDNTRGRLVASGTGAAGALTLQSGALHNDQGLIQATAALAIDTHGQTLTNTHSGASGGIVGQGTVNLSTGGLDNQAGYVGSGSGLAIHSAAIVNGQGAIRADGDVTLTSSGSVGNAQGLVSAGNTLTVQDLGATRTLAVTNTGGTLIAGQDLVVNSSSLGGDGALLSQGDMRVRLTQDYVHTGQFIANGTASLETTGTLTNQAALQAGTALDIEAATIDNQASGTISAAQVRLRATGSHTLTNRGLIDGTATFIETAALDNRGTGRIFGDHVAIDATTVTNDAENGVAAVIAARNRLDIGAATIDNREHALMFSAGDIAIGASLDAGHRATGAATTLNNASATIEALGNVDIGARDIDNTNEHFSTTVVELPAQSITEYQGQGSPNRYTPGTPDVFIFNDESDHLHTPEGNFERWLAYNYTRTTIETRVATSDPGQILSGGAMRITADTLTNDKSRIIAGGALTGNIATLNNTEVAGERSITDAGTVTSFWRDHDKGRDETGSSIAAYTPPTTIQAISLTPTVYQQHTAPNGTGTQISALSTATVTPLPTVAGSAAPAVHGGQTIPPITQVPALNGNTSGLPAVVRSGGVDTRVPSSSLFRPNPAPGATFLVETDPAFADFRDWLSSDYLLGALAIDPATTQKRLGDGFYEQRLVREQVAQLTGQRFLGDHQDDQAQYQALMNNGVTFATAHQLVPGIALSAEQMAQLTSDIVWLVEQTITLADGSTTRALVPQVYVRVQDGDLQAGGALIAGHSVGLNLTGELTNSASIAGRTVVALTAQNIHNLGGRISGADVGVAARGDLNNIGGAIVADRSLQASAGRDLNVVSTTRTQSNAQGSRTNMARVAGLYVTGGADTAGTLLASAGRDANLIAAAIQNQGSGDTTLAAGNTLNLGTLATASANSVVWNATNRRSDASRADVGTTVQAQGDLRLQAGGDLNARAASVQTQGDLLASAGRDIQLSAGQSAVQLDEAHQQIDKGFLSKKITTTRDTLEQTTAQATLLGGRSVLLQAGQDIAVQGSSVIGDGVAGAGGAGSDGATTTLLAGRDVLLSAQETQTQSSQFSQTRKSGLMSSGLSVTLGQQNLSTDQTRTTTGAAGATVGAIAGDVRIEAGRNYRQSGSELATPAGSIEVAAQDIGITEARTREQTGSEQKFKQSGLTLAISAPVVSAIQGIARTAQALSHTSDARTQALGAATLALQGGQALGALQNATNPADAASIGISISVGASQSSSTRQTTQNGAQGSSLSAAGSVNLSASGNNNGNEGNNSGNLLIQGSSVRAGEQVNLVAHNRIELHAATQGAQESSQQSSKSGSVGVGVSLGAQTGMGVTVAASVGKGAGAGEDVSHANTHIEAGQGVRLQSGGDTSLRGAVVQGQQVTASVGGQLTIESLQDTSSYTERSKSTGGSVTFGPAAGASLSLSNTKIDSQLASVTEQSAIQSGDGGFQVDVKGNSTLIGGAITSTDRAVDEGKNRFASAGQSASDALQSGALSLSDIDNTASYKASSVGVSVGAGASKGASAGIGSDKGNASSTTVAAISGIAGNQDAKTGGSQTGIARIFDADKVQRDVNAQVQITQEFGKQASRAVGDYAERQLKQATELKTLAEQTSDPQRKAELEQQAQTLLNDWGDSGTLRLAAHTVIGGLTAGVGGAAGAAAGTLSAPAVAEALRQAGVNADLAKGLTALASTAVGAAAGGSAGAAAAYNEVNNNFLAHAEASRRLKLKEELLNCQDDSCRQQTQAEITRLDQLDAWRDQQIEQACQSPASTACQSWTATIQVAASSYQGQYGNAVDTAERASVLNQAFKYQQAADNPFLHGVGKGLLKLTPPGLAVGAVGGIAATVQSLAEQGLTQTVIDAVKGLSDIPADLRARLGSDDPTVRGEALVDLVSLGAGATAVGAGGVKYAVTALERGKINAAIATAEKDALARVKVDNNARTDDSQQYDQFRKPDSTRPGGEWDWQKQAPNNGAVPGTQQTVTVQPGVVLDRFGQRGGEYMSPAGTPFEARALPPGKQADPYEQYQVLKPFTVTKEEIAPTFEQAGGGIQMRASIPEVQNGFATVNDLIKHGYLKDPKK